MGHLHMTPIGADWPWKPMPWSCGHKEEEVWNFAVIESAELWRLLRSMSLRTREPSSITLHGLTICQYRNCRGVKRLHFAIIPLMEHQGGK